MKKNFYINNMSSRTQRSGDARSSIGQRPRIGVRGDMRGFTLAEVLITLGIIGVVAALTMPALTASYQKKVLEVRIKKFVSVWKQAVALAQSDGLFDTTILKAGGNGGDIAEEFFNINFAPYMKVTETKKLSRGFSACFPDGSGVYVFPHFYTNFCVNCKDCKDETIHGRGNGKDIFSFYVTGSTEKYATTGLRTQYLRRCPNQKEYCTTLLEYDNWEIKDDYPW